MTPPPQHQNLAKGQWQKLTFFQQMANVGAEMGRAIKWRRRNTDYSRLALERMLELLDLTIDNASSRSRRKELMRLREVLADYFYFDNQYGSTDEQWEKYFLPFNYAASLGL